MSNDPEDFQLVARNRKARHDFDIRERLEAGIELQGAEVKSIREGKINISDAFAVIENGEVYLRNLHISPYKMAADQGLDPTRPRRLLLHKREIARLAAKVEQKGMTLIPLAIYFKNRRVKIELALAVGRKKYDKRDAIAKEDAARRMKQAMRRDMD